MVGIQQNADGTWYSGAITPQTDKFVATIKEAFSDEARLSACQREYGLVDGDFLPEDNACLMTYSIEFLPQIAAFGWSQVPYRFVTGSDHFTLYETNDFYFYFGQSQNAYIMRGRCEKMH